MTATRPTSKGSVSGPPLDALRAVLSAHEGEDVRHGSSADVWHLSYPPLLVPGREARRDRVNRCKRELLRPLLASPRGIYLSHHEDPVAAGVPARWSRAGKWHWNLPSNLNLEEPTTEYWLFALGNWRIHAATAPIEQSRIDPARAAETELLAWMQENRVAFLIDSFHDDVSWVVALGQP
jgi:hypothetical protein